MDSEPWTDTSLQELGFRDGAACRSRLCRRHENTDPGVVNLLRAARQPNGAPGASKQCMTTSCRFRL